MWEREGKAGKDLQQTSPGMTWHLSVPQPSAAEGPPVHTRNWHVRLQKALYFFLFLFEEQGSLFGSHCLLPWAL